MQNFYNLNRGTFVSFHIGFFVIIKFVEELFSNWFNIDIVKTWLARAMWIIFVVFGRRMRCRMVEIQLFIRWHLICLGLPSIMRCVFQMAQTDLSFFFPSLPIDFHINPIKFKGNPSIYYFFIFGSCSFNYYFLFYLR